MSRFLISAAAAALLASPVLAQSKEFSAELVGHAILPAKTLIAAPTDAPEALQTSGKFAPARRADAPTDGDTLPFTGQPVQGFSGISKIDDSRYYVLTDNGFGSKANSPDTMLFFHIIEPNWDTGEIALEKTVFLKDPNKVIPFVIKMEGSDSRYLTGGDLDIEGFQVIDGKIFIGEEFGPFVIVADAETGVVEEFYETFLGDKQIVSPDNYTVTVNNPNKTETKVNLNRSKGFEGFAASPDGQTLYPLLEGPVWDAEKGDYERVDGNEALRILEFKVADRAWTGKSWFYRLEADGHAIGDFNMIDDTRGLIIERDNGQGDAAQACGNGQTDNCFKEPAEFKRVYLIDMAGVEDGQPVHKVGYIDLMNIQDPNGVSRVETNDGILTFPFVTIEDVDIVDADHIIVGNDNNFPFSMGRHVINRDNNEMVLLKVSDFLKAHAE